MGWGTWDVRLRIGVSGRQPAVGWRVEGVRQQEQGKSWVTQSRLERGLEARRQVGQWEPGSELVRQLEPGPELEARQQLQMESGLKVARGQGQPE